MSRHRFLIAVTVEAEGVDAVDAYNNVLMVTGWPGDYSPPNPSLVVKGLSSSDDLVICKSQLLMATHIKDS